MLFVHSHGGGCTIGSSKSHTDLGARMAQGFLVDFRRALEFPFPAQIEDGLTVYDALLANGRNPDSIVITGDSAGGGLLLG